MTEYMARKLSGRCVQCGAPVGDDAQSVRCEPHRIRAAELGRARVISLRHGRAMRGACVDCGGPSHRYRCQPCAFKRKQRRAGISAASAVVQVALI